MSSIQLAQYRLRLSQRFRTHQAPDLRGFFGPAFADALRKHHYAQDGKPLFEYPRVQFKVMESTAILLGISEGAELLQRHCPRMDAAELGDAQITVLETDFETESLEIAAWSEPIEYRFVTPWLALNQKNFRSYVGSRSMKFRKDELSRIVVANCLGMTRSLGVELRHRIDATCQPLTSIKTTVDGHGMIGFVGRFQINLKLPDYLGLGKLVARGFGTVCTMG